MVNANQTMNNTKETITALGLSVLAKIIFNVPMMTLFGHIGLESYYAPIALNMLIDTSASLYLLIVVRKKTNINYMPSIRTFIKVTLCTLIMVVGLAILNIFVPNVTSSRFIAILQLLLYGIIGVIIYFAVAYKSQTIDEILGKDFIHKILARIKK